MKKLLLALFLLSQSLHAETVFIAHEGNKILVREGALKPRYSPCSTFKIAIALMGFEEGILKSETAPTWPFKKGYVDYLERWKQDHNPTSWIKNSCIWYSQLITGKMGADKFNAYLKKLDYGNKLSKNHLNCWLSSTLKIAPSEQVVFLGKLLRDKLSVSKRAHELTRKVLYIGDFHGWKLFGKTGSGSQLKADGSQDKDRQLGWFVGWLQKGKRKIIFAYCNIDEKPEKTSAGMRAKAVALERLKGLIS